MAMNIDLKDFTRELLDRALKKGFSDAEVYISNGASFNVSTLKGEVDKYQNSSSRGLSFRGTYNGKMGYTYSEWIDGEAIDIIIEEAIQNSEILEEEEQDKLFKGGCEYHEVESFSTELKNISIEEKINSALAMEAAAKNGNELIKAVDHTSVGYHEGGVAIANTYGLNLEYTSNGAGGSVSARAVKDGVTKTGGEFWRGLDWKQFEPEKLGAIAAEEAAAKIEAKSIKSGQYKIVMKNTAFASLVSTFCSVFFADKVQKGFSLLANKLGEAVASPAFTLRDDPVHPESQNTTPFDAEGVATYNKAVVENGTLKTFLHNLKTAAKDGVQSTGNASRSYKSSIGISPRNLYIAPGELSFDEIIEKACDGLYITSLAGLHSGANDVSGDFSLSTEGFLIENGKITKPVEQITVAGNFFALLNDIEAVADDLRFSSIGSPAVLIKSMSISGNSGE